MSPQMLRWGQKCEVAIDGEMVLKGWIEDVQPAISGERIGLVIGGRDVTGDLVDCAAAPKGPVEYNDLKLKDFCAKLCKPFDIEVRAEVDTGETMDMSIDISETVMSAIEKGARKRGLLTVSDGVGGLILTRSGETRAPGDVILGVNVLDAKARFSSAKRFSDVFVKSQKSGQGEKSSGKLDDEAAPLTPGTAPATKAPEVGDKDAPTGQRSREVAMQGHAKDQEVTRWRPTVKQARTSSIVKDCKTQAEWYVANARGASESVFYEVPGYRVNGELWRVNQMTHVTDAWCDFDKDLLIAGIVLTYDEKGSMTTLRITGKEAYDIMAEDDEEGSSGEDDESGNLDSRAEPLSGG